MKMYHLYNTNTNVDISKVTVFDMINAFIVYHVNTFIKAVSDTVFDMINAVYHDKPWIFIRTPW